MSFRKLLLAGIASVLFVMVVTGTVAVAALHAATDRYERLGRELAEDLTGAHELRAEAEALAAARRGRIQARIDETTQRFDQLLRELHMRNVDPESAKELGRIDVAGRAFVAAATSPDDSVATVLQGFDRFEETVTDFIEHQTAMFDDDLKQARIASWRHEISVLVTTALGLALSIGLAAIVMRKLGQ